MTQDDQSTEDRDTTLHGNAQPDPTSTPASDVAPSDAAHSVAESAPRPGVTGSKSLIKERFELEEQLGSGGMGTVFKARDLRKVEARDRQPWVAIKLLNENFKDHPAALISLQREARKSQTLTHPNIVKVYDFDRDGDTVFMTMELLLGRDLRQYILDHPGGVELDEVMRLTGELGGALQHAHQNGIVHSDLTPRNVFITSSGVAKVLDFGIAKAVATADSSPSSGMHTEFDPTSLAAYTPAYASLERLIGEDPDPADDIYGLACLVYELLTGQRPFGGVSALEVEARDLQPPRPGKLSTRQWRSLKRGLALYRDDRYDDAGQFLEDFLPRPVLLRNTIAVAAVLGLFLAASVAYQAYRGAAEQLAADNDLAARVEALDIENEKSRRDADQNLARLHQEYMDWAEDLIGSKQFAEASQFLDRVQEEAPQNSRLLALRVQLDVARANHQQRLEQEQQVRALTTRLISEAEADIAAGRLLDPPGNNAYEHYQQLVATTPDSPQAAALLQQLIKAHLDGAQSALASGDLSESKSWLDKLERIAPTLPQLATLRGELATARNSKQELENRVASLLAQANSRELRDAAERREELFLSVLAIEPNNSLAEQGLAQARSEINLNKQRILEQEQLATQAQLTEARQLLEQQPYAAKNFQRAYSKLLEVKRTNPGMSEIDTQLDKMPQHYIEAVTHQLNAGDYAEAQLMLQAASLLTPDNEKLDELRTRLKQLEREKSQPILPATF